MLRLTALALVALGCAAPVRSAIHIQSAKRECGAVAIGPHVAITASHCVGHGADTGVTWDAEGSASKPLRIVTASRASDLAVVSSDAPFPYWSLTRRGVEGEAVTAVAPVYQYAKGRGVLNSSTDLDPAALYWETDLTIIPGWSGSPVYGLDGKVVGIVSSCSGMVAWVGQQPMATCSPRFAVIAGIE